MGTTYYIGTNGSDSNAGTADQPFASVAAVASMLQPGDTVLFLEGTYTNATYGALNEDGSREIWKSNHDVIVRLNNVHGTEAEPITFKPAPGAEVVLKYDGNGAFMLRDSSHIRIEGFEIEGPNQTVDKQDAQDAQWTYRIATSEDAEGNPVYEYFERDPFEVLDTLISDQIDHYASLGIDQSGSGKPTLFQASAISLPAGSHDIEIINNVIHDSAAHAVSGHGGNDYVSVIGNHIYNNNWYTSNGTHAVSFKGLVSLDDNDGAKIIIQGNHLHDNYNLLISWVMTKTAVTRHIDEGKSIHIQSAEAASGWDHGRILIDNNLIERAGNAGITLNDVRGATVTNNVIIDGAWINQLIAQDSDPASEYFGFFTQQGVPEGHEIRSGGLRVTSSDDNVIAYNIIQMLDDRAFTIDSEATANSTNTQAYGNIWTGGSGLRIRSEVDVAGDLVAGFVEVADMGFEDIVAGDYRMTEASSAHQAGIHITHVAEEDDLVDAFATDDIIYGHGGNDGLNGHAGADRIHGGHGRDWLYGDAGNDVLYGDEDEDAIFAGDDDDIAHGGAGGDSLDGGFGNDELHGEAGVDWLYGSFGDDVLYGGADGDALFGQEGQDTLNGGTGDDSLDGGVGNDILKGDAGIDWLYGGDGNDMLNGGSETDALFGEAGLDILYGGDGGDSLDGGSEDDSLFGNAGDDWLFGGTGDDLLDGGAGSDVLFGNDGIDQLRGGADGDSLDGGEGNDWLDGGAGIDILFGGAGADTFFAASAAEAGDVIRDFVSGEDRVVLDPAGFGLDGSWSGQITETMFSAGAGLPGTVGTGAQFYLETDNQGLWLDPTGGDTSDIFIVAGFETGVAGWSDIWFENAWA